MPFFSISFSTRSLQLNLNIWLYNQSKAVGNDIHKRASFNFSIQCLRPEQHALGRGRNGKQRTGNRTTVLGQPQKGKESCKPTLRLTGMTREKRPSKCRYNILLPPGENKRCLDMFPPTPYLYLTKRLGGQNYHILGWKEALLKGHCGKAWKLYCNW